MGGPGLLGRAVPLPALAGGSTRDDVVRYERRALATGARAACVVVALCIARVGHPVWLRWPRLGDRQRSERGSLSDRVG